MFTLIGVTSRREIVNTIIHEYAHLAYVGHHEPPGDPISNKGSTKVRGLDMFEALNNAESYMRFVRAVSSVEAAPIPAAPEQKTGGTQESHWTCEEPPDSSEEKRTPRNCEDL